MKIRKGKVLKILLAVSAILFTLCGLSATEEPLLLIPMCTSGLYILIFMRANQKEEVVMDARECATIEDCTDMYQIKGMLSVIEDGEIRSFEYEKSTATDGESEQC